MATTVKMTQRQAAALHRKAHLAGMDAGGAARPVPMYVVERANPWDDNSPVTRRYAPVEGGVCGFAWVKVRPAMGPFVRYLKAHGTGHKGYTGGWDVWVSAFNQSLERKTAYANAYAKVLTEAGLTAYGQSRMD
jgi:hypothetical protein